MKMQENLYMIIGSILLVVCIYFYANSASKSKILVESFEGKIGKDTVDYGASDTSSINVTASRRNSKCGGQSLEISYHLKPYGYVYAAKGYDLYHVKDSSSWRGGKAGWLVPPDKMVMPKIE
jgi:hypothetical protein